MCVLYYCLSHSIHAGYITRCVCFTIICNITYIQTKLLQCYYREIVNIQSLLRDVKGPGVDDLPVDDLPRTSCVFTLTLCPSTWSFPSQTPNRWTQFYRKRFSSSSSKVRPRFLITLTLSSFLMLNFK